MIPYSPSNVQIRFLEKLAYLSLHTLSVCKLCDISSKYYDEYFEKTHLASIRRAPGASFVEPAVYCDYCHQASHRSSTPNRAETAHSITTNSQSRFKTQTQTHKTAKTLQAVQQKNSKLCHPTKTHDLSSSDVPPGPAHARTFQRLAPDSSC